MFDENHSHLWLMFVKRACLLLDDASRLCHH